jgi:phosphatidate cytidylyltransferase
LNPALDSAPSPDPQPKKGPSNLRLRAIWGALAAALLFGCTFGGPISFGLFFAAVQAVMLKEFYRIMRAKGYQPAFWIGIFFGTLLFLYVAFFTHLDVQIGNKYIVGGGVTTGMTIYPPLDGSQATSAVEDVTLLSNNFSAEAKMITASIYFLPVWGVLLLVGLLVREIIRWPKDENPFGSLAITLLGICYVSIPMTLLNNIAHHGLSFDPRRVFFLVFLIWAADTGAYFAGKNLGKHKLAPSISPGKTWEGWAGGALLTLSVGWAAGYFLPDIPLSHRLVAAGVVAVFGPLGDLAESMLKRSAGVKDSGTFLPGHGGLLDRFDAFLLVLPVLALLQVLAG